MLSDRSHCISHSCLLVLSLLTAALPAQSPAYSSSFFRARGTTTRALFPFSCSA